MRAMPLDIGLIHFVGIGGIGMSGIAEILHNLGYKVRGSDLVESPTVQRLRGLGIPVAIGHAAENVAQAQVVVISSAVKADNPEVAAARELFLPVVRRAEMLSELMRLRWAIAVAGSHGKTTTTSLIAQLLDAAELDPTVINGGIINAYGTNARLGEGDWIVVEADESDGSFTRLPATIAVVTNVDAEHLDHYGSVEALHSAFETFLANIPFYGLALCCIDHPTVQALIARIEDRRIVTYGFGPQADVRGENIRFESEGSRFDLVLSGREHRNLRIADLFLPMLGQHNVENALAVCALAIEMGLEEATLRRALETFDGVKRRFTKTGEAGGITVIDDYAHHPVEIRAVLRAARQATQGRVIAVVQPHRYSRLRDLFEDFCTCFNDADGVLVADVFAAGEEPLPGIDRDALVEGLRAHGHRQAAPLAEPLDLARIIARAGKKGDIVVCLGAGNITNWAQALPAQIAVHLGGGK